MRSFLHPYVLQKLLHSNAHSTQRLAALSSMLTYSTMYHKNKYGHTHNCFLYSYLEHSCISTPIIMSLHVHGKKNNTLDTLQSHTDQKFVTSKHTVNFSLYNSIFYHPQIHTVHQYNITINPLQFTSMIRERIHIL